MDMRVSSGPYYRIPLGHPSCSLIYRQPNPLHNTGMAVFYISAVLSKALMRAIKANEAFYLSINTSEWRLKLFSVDFVIHWLVSIRQEKATNHFTPKASVVSPPQQGPGIPMGLGGLGCL